MERRARSSARSRPGDERGREKRDAGSAGAVAATSPTCSCHLTEKGPLVGLLLIGVAAWGKGFGIVSSIHIIGGVIAVGFFLLLIAIVGLIGAIHHHQVMLFFYMIILGLVFIFQFGVSCSCLAINRTRQVSPPPVSTWPILSNKTKTELEKNLDCCGLLNSTADFQTFQAEFVVCPAVSGDAGTLPSPGDPAPCMLQHSDEALKILGGVGLFFSFTEILGVWLAMRYRNQKDPRANPSAFL
uniref:Tetraspanin 31 n=1 Tax=Apteryx owenii TaxID=8824 RepID=A0A8B9P8S8_APTOW